MANIHPSANVSDEVDLGKNVEVGSNSHITGNVTIGSGTRIGSNCVIKGPASIGSDNEFFAGTVIGTKPQDWSYEPEDETAVTIGDSNKIREYVTINCSTAGEETRIGNENMIMAYCHVGHDCAIGDHVDMANNVNLSGHVTINDNVVVSGQTGFHQFVRIGEYAMVGGFSRVVKDVVPYCRVSGIPIEVYGPNSVGLKRNDFSSQKRTLIRKVLKVLFRDHNNTSNAVDELRDTYPDQSFVERLVEFIETSERGIHR